MLKTIKSIKKDRKKFIQKNYFKIVLPLLIFMISNSITYLIWNYFMMDSTVSCSDWFIFFCLITILFLQFAVCPVTIVWFYKTYLLISKNQEKSAIKALGFLKEKGIFKNIIKLNFLPSLCNVSMLIFSNSNIVYHTKNYILLFICCFLKLFVNYKLFICNYYFSVSNKNTRNILNFSFSIMKNNFKTFFAFYISFAGWFILTLILKLILKSICLGELFSIGMLLSLKIYTPFLNSFAAFFYGIGFYLFPYLLIIKAEYCKKIIGSTVFETY